VGFPTLQDAFQARLFPRSAKAEVRDIALDPTSVVRSGAINRLDLDDVSITNVFVQHKGENMALAAWLVRIWDLPEWPKSSPRPPRFVREWIAWKQNYTCAATGAPFQASAHSLDGRGYELDHTIPKAVKVDSSLEDLRCVDYAAHRIKSLCETSFDIARQKLAISRAKPRSAPGRRVAFKVDRSARSKVKAERARVLLLGEWHDGILKDYGCVISIVLDNGRILKMGEADAVMRRAGRGRWVHL
jgi:hypothetical protein